MEGELSSLGVDEHDAFDQFYIVDYVKIFMSSFLKKLYKTHQKRHVRQFAVTTQACVHCP